MGTSSIERGPEIFRVLYPPIVYVPISGCRYNYSMYPSFTKTIFQSLCGFDSLFVSIEDDEDVCSPE